MQYIIGWKADANLTIDNFVAGFKVLNANLCVGQESSFFHKARVQ